MKINNERDDMGKKRECKHAKKSERIQLAKQHEIASEHTILSQPKYLLELVQLWMAMCNAKVRKI